MSHPIIEEAGDVDSELLEQPNIEANCSSLRRTISYHHLEATNLDCQLAMVPQDPIDV